MFKFEFTLDETNQLLTALAKMPYEFSAALIDKIRKDAQGQAQAAQPVPTEE